MSITLNNVLNHYYKRLKQEIITRHQNKAKVGGFLNVSNGLHNTGANQNAHVSPCEVPRLLANVSQVDLFQVMQPARVLVQLLFEDGGSFAGVGKVRVKSAVEAASQFSWHVPRT